MDNHQLKTKFIEELQEKGRSSSTIVAYKKDIEQLGEFLEKEIKHAKTDDLKAFIDHLVNEKKYTLKTVSRKINTLKTFFKFLKEKQVSEIDHAEPLEHPELEKKLPRILSTLEYKAVRDTARGNDRLYAMIELLLQTGIRISELSALHLDDLNDKNTKLTIQAYKTNPQRTIELNEAAHEVLDFWLEKREHYENDKGYVFNTKTGNKVLVRNIRTAINRTFRKVGITDATVNDIRNTFIVYQLDNNVKLEKVSQYIGHQRKTSTEKYLELLNDEYDPKINKIQVL
jgi:site-specific recombinase XerD